MKTNILLYCKTASVLLFFINAYNFSFAQKPAIEWQKIYGGRGSDWAYDIKQTSDSGYIVVGHVTSIDGILSDAGHHGTGTSATQDIWILKLDNVGEIEWHKCLGGTKKEQAIKVIQTSDEVFFVIGQTNSSDGDVSTPNFGNTDAWVVKLDKLGAIEWEKSYGGTGADQANAVIQMEDGNYIIAARTTSNDTQVKNNNGGSDYWILKLNTLGDTLWTRTYGGADHDIPYSIEKTNEGGFIVAGETTSNNTGYVGETQGSKDIWVIKCNAEGIIEWSKTYGGSGSDIANSIKQVTDGGYIIAGESNSVDGDVTNAWGSGKADSWIIRLNDSGDIVWEETFGGTIVTARANDIFESSYNTFVVAGSYTGSVGEGVGDISEIFTGRTAWLIEIDAAGKLLWERNLVSSQQTANALHAIVPTFDGGMATTGYSSSANFWILKLYFCTEEQTSISTTICTNESYDFNGTFLSQAGQYVDTLQTVGGCDSIVTLTLEVVPAPATPTITADGNELSTKEFSSYQWILDGLEIDGATSRQYNTSIYGDYQVIISNGICSDTSEVYALSPATSINSTAWSKSLNVYPNPADNELTILYDSQGYSVSISNLSGQEQLQTQATGNAKIDINNLLPGMYILKILENGEIKAVQKIIKE